MSHKPPAPSPIPRILKLVIARAGIDKAAELVRRLGGRQIWMPSNPGSDHAIAAVVGLEVTLAIAATISNEHVVIPMRGFDVRRQMQIDMIRAGASNNAIAAATHCSLKTIGRLRRALREGRIVVAMAGGAGASRRGDPRQLDIEDFLKAGAR